MARSSKSAKRGAPIIKVILFSVLVFALTGCTVKHGPVSVGVIPGTRTMNPQDEHYGSKVFKNLCGKYTLCDETDGFGYVYSIFEHLKKAAHLGPLDRSYSKEFEREAMGIALLVLSSSTYSPYAMLEFWERVENNDALRERVARLSRNLSPQDRVTLIKALLTKLSVHTEDSSGLG
jgi:hypothetical protein